jgi:hypothetical protein
MQVMPVLRVPEGSNETFLAALLFMRGASSFQSAFVLAERGLTQDVRTLVRSCFESVFWLGALRKDATFAETLVQDDFQRRAKIARPLLKLPPDSGLEQEHIDKLDSFLKKLKESGIEEKQISVADAARRAGLSEIYDTFYRGLSNDAAHPSITALNRYAESDQQNNVIGLRCGPDVDDVGDTMSYLCTALIYLLFWTGEFFPNEERQRGLERCWSDYKQLIDSGNEETRAD